MGKQQSRAHLRPQPALKQQKKKQRKKPQNQKPHSRELPLQHLHLLSEEVAGSVISQRFHLSEEQRNTTWLQQKSPSYYAMGKLWGVS